MVTQVHIATRSTDHKLKKTISIFELTDTTMAGVDREKQKTFEPVISPDRKVWRSAVNNYFFFTGPGPAIQWSL